ncbi:hypothetical protein [Comamonas testosteroni]|uniref:hypothetical protein n=1 Tax=Comamonas testosteroni TaxID=285 RepID=UPI0005B377E1|nr:hypothetical protein [Comamonas testosteroni]
MLLLEQVIKSRLAGRSALAAWQVRGASQLCDRTQVPAIEVRMSGAGLGDVSREAAQLEPRWSCVLVNRRSDTAAAELDAAMEEVVGCLHGWRPAVPGGRAWSELRAAGVREAEFVDAGLVGYAVEFTTVSVFESLDA